MTTDKFDEESEKDLTGITYINLLRHNPIAMQLNKKEAKHYNCLLGNMIVAVLEGSSREYEQAKAETLVFLERKEIETTRKWYVMTSLICLIVGILIFKIGYFSFSRISCLRGSLDSLCYCYYGFLGGIFSILGTSGSIKYTARSGKWLIVLEILSKLVISMVSAFILMLAYDIGIMFQGIAKDAEKEFRILICLLGGLSEKFVPSLVAKIENTEVEKNAKKDTDSV